MTRRIVKAAIQLPTGMIIEGHRHHDCLAQMHSIMNLSVYERRGHVQGFITSDGFFVNRREAMEIAIKSHQVSEKYKGMELYSEDLY